MVSDIKLALQKRKLVFAREILNLKTKVEVLQACQTKSDKTALELELFDLWDIDNSGSISLERVSQSILTCKELVETVSVGEVLRSAETTDGKLDRAQFGHLLEKLVDQAGGSFGDWVQLLILQWHPPVLAAGDGRSYAPAQAPAGSPDAINRAAQDGRMRNLFTLFDMDLDDRVSFKEVALGLRKIAPHVPMVRASEAAVQVLLKFDEDHDRMLDYMEFVHFVCAFLLAGRLEFGQVADALVLAAARPDATPEEQAELDTVLTSSDFSNFIDYRMHQIFDLLDGDRDGFISFQQLCLGLHKFEPTKPLARSVQHTAALLEAVHLDVSPADPEAQKLLDRSEFAQVLSKFVEESGADFHQVADYLVAISATAAEDSQGTALPGWFFTPVSPNTSAPAQ